MNIRKKQFTFIELMVAIFLSSIIIAAAIALLNVMQWGMNLTRRTSSATNIANSRIARLQIMPFGDIETMEEINVRVNEEGVPDPDGFFIRSTDVGAESTNCKEITVTVTAPWRPDTQDLNVTLTTIMVNPDVLKMRGD